MLFIHTDHRHDEHGGHQHQKAFKTVLADAEFLKEECSEYTGCACMGHTAPHVRSKRATAGAVEIHQDDADDQGGFYAFSESNQES